MNIKINSQTDDFLNGNIEFIPEIYQEENNNPVVIFRKDEDGNIGVHLSGWDCKESVDVYSGNDILELLEALNSAKIFLTNLVQEMKDGQMPLFEDEKVTRQITIKD